MPRDAVYLPQRRLVSQEDAAMIERADVPRSKFVGTWSRKTAFDAAYLVPFLIDEVLPGDHLSYNVTAYIRLSTPVFPIFDNQRIDTFFFYVPARILWTNWAKFMGEQASPADTIAYTIPILNLAVADLTLNSIYDHFGLPVGNIAGGETIDVNSLPLRAYNRIWNDWFRDQNVMDSIPVRTGDTGDLVADYALRRRSKAHDYFTSALPWPQKFTAPSIPIAGLAPVRGIGALNSNWLGGVQAVLETPATPGGAAVGNNYGNWKQFWDPAINNQIFLRGELSSSGGTIQPYIYADLSTATGVAINQFRQAFLINQLLERDARGGTRYVELIRSHFGVTNPDFRLQRPEYIGGGQTPLVITPIAQTAPTATEPLGALGAAGTAAGNHNASYAATEHGYIIGLINVRTELSYQQGLHKLWDRRTRYDFYWPALAQLGEQSILRREIYCTGNDASDLTVFGYQERWHEYRTHVSEVTGIFRSNVAGTLDAWHLAQDFASAPTLSQTFIQEDPPMSRVLAAGTLAANQQYLADIMISRTAVRPIPSFGTPVMLGRF